jgi:hypothetical protein
VTVVYQSNSAVWQAFNFPRLFQFFVLSGHLWKRVLISFSWTLCILLLMRIFFIRSRILFCGLLNNPDIVILSLTSISCMHFQVIKIDNLTCLHTEFQYRWRVVNRISLRFSLSIKVGIPHFIFITLLWHKIWISNCQRVMVVVPTNQKTSWWWQTNWQKIIFSM